MSPFRAALALAAAAAAGCGGTPLADRAPTREYERLRARLAALAAQDPVVADAAATGGNVKVAVRGALVERVFRRVAAAYLDRVELDLKLGVRFHERGDVGVRALGRTIHAGEWRVEGVVHRAQGVLRARQPEVRALDAQRLGLLLPVTLQAGRGTASVRFQWDGRSVGGLVCRDFEVRRSVRGVVLPADYEMSGAFRLSAGRTGLRAEPEFPVARHRLRVDLAPESWHEVQQALEEQDKLLRCGLALDPGDVRRKLERVLRDGFEVALPRSLFRSVAFPAGVREAAEVEDRRVELEVAPAALRVTPHAVWYGATVTARVSPNSAPAP